METIATCFSCRRVDHVDGINACAACRATAATPTQDARAALRRAEHDLRDVVARLFAAGAPPRVLAAARAAAWACADAIDGATS